MNTTIVNAGKSEIAFELTHSGDTYTVIACHHRPSLNLPNADAMVGMTFVKGNNPDFYPIGYARTIQQGVNRA